MLIFPEIIAAKLKEHFSDCQQHVDHLGFPPILQDVFWLTQVYPIYPDISMNKSLNTPVLQSVHEKLHERLSINTLCKRNSFFVYMKKVFLARKIEGYG